ncbi:hypothetical protein LYNGBM3L_73160 [Moorena producens 3L]|uniref:Uncharacterized protein n=1 Tax=Moorena producens 3L TaxID=489825 RepID=F4Y351_9CYAN|nr:hypothetical protein LYNGBM3L_73160 [Moorena producens 3L]NER86534.1 hypothetical protein [Moorena sp. SIO3A2]OLT63641.1 hypothetical protein BI334_00155 [Moorena producens 3L]
MENSQGILNGGYEMGVEPYLNTFSSPYIHTGLFHFSDKRSISSEYVAKLADFWQLFTKLDIVIASFKFH